MRLYWPAWPSRATARTVASRWARSSATGSPTAASGASTARNLFAFPSLTLMRGSIPQATAKEPHEQRHPRGHHHRRGAGGLHRGALLRAREPAPAGVRGIRVRRPADDHLRRRQLSGLSRRHPRPRADADDARAGRALRRRDGARRRHPRRLLAAAAAGLRRRAGAPDPIGDRGHRRDGPPARTRERGHAPGPRRQLLRRLRCRLLPRQERRGRRRRRLGDGGGDVPRQVRDEGHRGAPPRRVPGVSRSCTTTPAPSRTSTS